MSPEAAYTFEEYCEYCMRKGMGDGAALRMWDEASTVLELVPGVD